MAYTHNFELNVDGIVVEGEMSFDGGKNVTVKTSTTVEVSAAQAQKMLNVIEQVALACQACGVITKLSIQKK